MVFECDCTNNKQRKTSINEMRQRIRGTLLEKVLGPAEYLSKEFPLILLKVVSKEKKKKKKKKKGKSKNLCTF